MAEILVSPGISITETDKSAYASRPLVAGAAIIGPTVRGQVNVPTVVSSYSDYTRRFGSTFDYEQEGTLIQQEYLTSIAAKSYFEQGGDSLLVVRVAPANYFTSAESTTIESYEDGSDIVPFVLKTLSTGEALNNTESATYREYISNAPLVHSDPEDPDSPMVAQEFDERKDGSLLHGSSENVRFEISNVDPEKGTFSLSIRRGDDTAKDKVVLESYNNLSLDPNNANYIAKAIGDQHAVVLTDDDGVPYVDVQGDYTNKSAYVYVASVSKTLNYLATDGETINSDINGVSFENYLPAEQVGGFYGATGVVGKRADVQNGVFDFFEDIKKSSTYPQGIAPAEYDTAIELLSNVDEYQINIVSAPGLLNTGTVSKLISLAEGRGDCIAVVDLSNADDSTRQAAEDAQSQNSSYAATYYPWLQMYSSTGRLVWVPASVVIPGVYVFNDKQAAPWYAPAGMMRGGIQGVVQTKMKLTKGHRDTLYKKNVNPIATLPGAGIVVYGQKTLQKKQTALDRVNARRLLIELKGKVKNMASRLLFEHNTVAVRNSFRARLEPYLESVVQRNGLYSYKVVIDELNDAETIDRNEFRCQIYVQPTKAIEFIYIDFTITATGVEFN